MTSASVSSLDLSGFVEAVHYLEPLQRRTRRVDRLPDGRTALVVRVAGRGRGDAHLAGPRTRALLKDATGFERAVMIQFKPGWSAPLVGMPARELTDRYVLLEDAWGPLARDLVLELVAAGSVSEIIDRLARAVARTVRPSYEPASAGLARRAARLLEEEPVRVESIAERLGVTSRHLRRAFAENIGVGPKVFARCVRLQRAVHLARSSGDWGRIAVAAGYYDQAHLIADFRALIGLTPRAYAERMQHPLAGDHAASLLE